MTIPSPSRQIVRASETTDSGAPADASVDTTGTPRAKTPRQKQAASTQVSGALIGYMRVSTEAQNDDRQFDSLTEAGVARIFTDHGVSSVKHRPALEEALAYLRPGDALVIRELDRLGRRTIELLGFVEDLHARDVNLRILTLGVDTKTPAGKLVLTMMAAYAELEHSLLKERVISGLEAARARGRIGGRPRVMNADQVLFAQELRTSGKPVREISRLMGIPEATVRRRLSAPAS